MDIAIGISAFVLKIYNPVLGLKGQDELKTERFAPVNFTSKTNYDYDSMYTKEQ